MRDKVKPNMTFADPPPEHRRNRSYDWDAISKELRANPTQWALMEKQGRASIVTAIRGGKISNFHPRDGYEVTTADNTFAKPRTCDIFVRYSPDADTKLTKKEQAHAMAEARRLIKEKENN